MGIGLRAGEGSSSQGLSTFGKPWAYSHDSPDDSIFLPGGGPPLGSGPARTRDDGQLEWTRPTGGS